MSAQGDGRRWPLGEHPWDNERGALSADSYDDDYLPPASLQVESHFSQQVTDAAPPATVRVISSLTTQPHDAEEDSILRRIDAERAYERAMALRQEEEAAAEEEAEWWRSRDERITRILDGLERLL